MSISRYDFDLRALYAALDEQRQARGLTWAETTRQINAAGSVVMHPISTSTVVGLRSKPIAEADGVLQMLRWLNRTPESFVHGLDETLATSRLPEADNRDVLRFDTTKLHGELERKRKSLGLTWK